MKKIFFLLAFTAIAFINNSFAQEASSSDSSQLIQAYFKVKDALVGSNASLASQQAQGLTVAINASSIPALNDTKKVALLKDANAISQSADLRVQREKFAALSATMLELAKSVKLSKDPVYLQYCPMKKASWLSSTQAIKNPYFGNAMLTCGAVKETL